MKMNYCLQTVINFLSCMSDFSICYEIQNDSLKNTLVNLRRLFSFSVSVYRKSTTFWKTFSGYVGFIQLAVSIIENFMLDDLYLLQSHAWPFSADFVV